MQIKHGNTTYIHMLFSTYCAGKKIYITMKKFQQARSKHMCSCKTTQEHKDLRENPFSLKRKIAGQTLNNFTILNRDYNT